MGDDLIEAFTVKDNLIAYKPGDVLIISTSADRTVLPSDLINSSNKLTKMKEIIIKKLIIMYSILFFVYAAEAHNSNKSITTGDDTSKGKITVAISNRANAKAVNDFNKRFNKAEGARWISDKGGFVSNFKEDGFTNIVCYDRKGNWEYSIIFYNESKLPRDVRGSVKSVYYDMAIVLVREVQTTKGKGYVVNLEDKATIRIVKVNDDGEMETIQEIVK